MRPVKGKNITHQQKKMNEADLRHFRDRFGIPIPDDRIADAPFFRPEEDAPEMRYMRERRTALGGSVPKRVVRVEPVRPALVNVFEEFSLGTGERKASTTMVFVKLLAKLLRDKDIGKLCVPIVPDEARTFGMESLFRAVGIYSSIGQLYEPVDMDTLLYYKEAKDGQILEEGINEAGSLSSFIAAGTAYATHGVNTIPFYIYYSMFGFQRVGDFIWAAADSRCRGFLLGGTAGRTTLAGEGLQHQDGNSHTLALTVPNCRAYDPAYAFELATIIKDGIKRMYGDGEAIFYYLTVMNEQYEMPAMPRRRRGRHYQGAVSLPAVGRDQGEGAGAAHRQRRHPQRGRQGAGAAREVRRGRRRVERDELQRALPRRPPRRSLEHVAPRREAARGVRDRAARGDRGRRRGGVGLPQEPAGHDFALGGTAHDDAWHRRLWPQ